MSFISKNNMAKAGLFWSISLAILIPAYLFVIQRQFNDLENIEITRDGLVRDYNEAKMLSSEEAMNKFYNQLEEMKATYSRFVIPSKDNIQSLASIEIEKISKETGLEAFHIDPWSSGEVAAFSECKYIFGQPMDVTFNATFNEFAKFINKLEDYKSVIFIDTFSINRSNEKDKKHQVRMSLEVLVQKQSTVKG